MNKMTTTLSALAISASSVVAFSPAAHAGNGIPGGNVNHAADDSGYNQPIVFTCSWDAPANQQPSWTYAHGLGLGQTSKSWCRDADGIYVAAGKNVQCWGAVPLIGTVHYSFDATGWHKISDVENWMCYHQLD